MLNSTFNATSRESQGNSSPCPLLPPPKREESLPVPPWQWLTPAKPGLGEQEHIAGSSQADETGRGLGLNPDRALSSRPRCPQPPSHACKGFVTWVWSSLHEPAGKSSAGCPGLAGKPEPARETPGSCFLCRFTSTQENQPGTAAASPSQDSFQLPEGTASPAAHPGREASGRPSRASGELLSV